MLDSVNIRLIDEAQIMEAVNEEAVGGVKPSPLFSFLRNKVKKNRKLTAALLAFPFPLGMVGMHRIYLGTAPYVPVVYIGSIGGVFGILPFIDFCMILFENDLERFSNNKKVFMWVE